MTEKPDVTSQLILEIMRDRGKSSNGISYLSLGVSFLALAVAVATAGVLFLNSQTGNGAQVSGQAAQLTAAPAPVPAPTAPSAFRPSENVRVASSDGDLYAFDPGTGMYFALDGSEGGARQISPDMIPAAVVAELNAGRLAAPGGQGSIDALDRATEAARAAMDAQSRDNRRPRVNTLLSANPEIATQILDTLDQASGFTVGDDEPVVYAFFDPQCPFCHRAYEALLSAQGYRVRWLPVVTLGDGALPLLAYAMGEAGLEPVEGDVRRPFLAPDEDRDARFHEIMTVRGGAGEAELEDAHAFILDENMEIFRLLYSGEEEIMGVPSFMVPKPDGGAAFLRGWDDRTGALIAQELGL